jgi:acyl-CoA hydrolase
VSEQAAGRAAKTVADTRITLAQVMMPKDANFQGVIHGGVIMKLIDEAAGVSAYRFCRRRVVTAHIDQIDFHHPVQIGSLVTIKASVNFAGRTSVEIGVRVEAEDLTTGDITHTNSAYLVFVALNANGRPAQVPELVPETAEDRRRWAEAEARRARRIAARAAPTSRS